MINSAEMTAGAAGKKLPAPQRALSVDALRGLSILLMVLSAVIPFGVLPSWMYHAQTPPPEHAFNPNLPGITWVDLIFPFFLFTMGAAIPLALDKKIKQNVPLWKIILSLLQRGLLLAGFAIYIFHINTIANGGNPDWKIWVLRLSGFALLFPMLAQLPKNWNTRVKYSVRIIGLCLACLLLSLARFQDEGGFSIYNSDIIILVLANVSFFGGLIWLLTRDNWLLRLGIAGIIIAARLSAPLQDWVNYLWNISPIPWLFDVQYLQYLLIIIPGTIIGDLMLQAMKVNDHDLSLEKSFNKTFLILIAAIMVIINIIAVIGLKARIGFETFLCIILLSGLSWVLINKQFKKDDLIYKLLGWGIYWIILGFLFEPYEGGIKKDHPTLSYYFVLSGLAIFVLIAFHIVIDILNKKKPFNLIIQCGQNPLIAYAGINNLVYPIFILSQLNVFLDSIAATPWLGVLKGVFVTYLTALSTRIFTKYKIFLKT